MKINSDHINLPGLVTNIDIDISSRLRFILVLWFRLCLFFAAIIEFHFRIGILFLLLHLVSLLFRLFCLFRLFLFTFSVQQVRPLRLIWLSGPVDICQVMRWPVTSLMIEPQKLELIGKVSSELLVFGARVLPVMHRPDLVEKLWRLHWVRSQIDKETLVHVGHFTMVWHNHNAIVFDQRHGEQRLYPQVHPAVVNL